jgi:hypothetical protein
MAAQSCRAHKDLGLRGTFLPFLRALDSAIAIACLRLFTFSPLPPLPLFAWDPRLIASERPGLWTSHERIGPSEPALRRLSCCTQPIKTLEVPATRGGSLVTKRLTRARFSTSTVQKDQFALDLPQPETSATDAGSSALSGTRTNLPLARLSGARTVSQAGRSLGATAEKAVPFLDADAVRALPSMISRSAPMPVASSSSRRSGIWPTLGYAALAAILLAIPNKRPGERSEPADRGRPASAQWGLPAARMNPERFNTSVPTSRGVVGMRLHPGKFRGLAGRTFSGGPTSRSVKIECSPLRRALYFTVCWRSSQPLRP